MEKLEVVRVNGVDIEWDVEKGTFTFFGIPSVLFWINPSLMTMLLPLANEIGHDLFRLLVAQSASTGTEEDYHAMVTVLGDTFEEGFVKWGAAVSSAGWGTFELQLFDLPSKRARVRVSNTWELIMQKDLPEHWGCPFIQGKIIGIFNHALNTTCWADEVVISYDPDNLYVEFDVYESFKTISKEIDDRRVAQMQESELSLASEVTKKTSELNEINETLTQALALAEQASRAKSEFLSSMSHELRTPMNAILGFAQILMYHPKDPLSEKQKSFVDQILNGGSHLLELIDQVLELNKIEAGKLSLNVEHVSVREVLDETLGLMQNKAGEEGIEIRDRTVGHDFAPLWTDRTRLTQALLNLLSNAVKYNREGGTVTLSCQEMPKQMLRIKVADSGLGIPLEKQENLFKPFERLGREAGMIQGTGIGLTITKQIVELMDGRVGFESEEGEGSTFWVEVPISRDHVSGPKQVEVNEPVAPPKQQKPDDGPVIKVLYVEDNPANMRLMEAVVGHIPNTRLLTAYNAELGVDLAIKERPELILLDINLPGMSGIEALGQLQAAPETKDIPVIAITAAAMPKDVEAGLRAGFRAYITKPINVSELVQVIESSLEDINSIA